MEIFRRKGRSSMDDDLAAAKAAAWAWHQHGSGSETSLVSESDVSRALPPPRLPSRYKVEAMLATAAGWSRTPSPNPEAKSLLDSYEHERLSKQLGHFVAEPGGTEVGLRKTETLRVDQKWRKSKKLLKGFLAKHAVACGSSRDVDDRAQRLQPLGGRPARTRVRA